MTTGRSSSSAPRASTSTTATARPTSRAWRACGARRSATAMRSSSRRRRRRCASSPSPTSSTAAATIPPSSLPERLKEIAPVPISKVFFCNSGSEANDTQMKLVWYMNNGSAGRRRRRSSAASAPITASPSRRPRSPASPETTPISTCRSPASFTPAARIIIATRRTARARRNSRAGSPTSSKS